MEKQFRVLRPQGVVVMGQVYKSGEIFTAKNIAALTDLLITRGLIEQIKDVEPKQNKAILKPKKGGKK